MVCTWTAGSHACNTCTFRDKGGAMSTVAEASSAGCAG